MLFLKLMNASNTSFNTLYPVVTRGIRDPAYSISCAVQQFKYLKELAGLNSPRDETLVEVVVQAYHFGEGYINYALSHADNGYTAQNARAYRPRGQGYTGTSKNSYYAQQVMCYWDPPAYVEGDGQATGVFLWPVPGFTNIFDQYGSPRSHGTHRGIDISSGGILGAEIVAADGGTITQAVYGHASWGNYVTIDHGNGYTTLYAHCQGLSVAAGQMVSAGQCVGYVGSTGVSTGAHLHFEVQLNGTLINPTSVL